MRYLLLIASLLCSLIFFGQEVLTFKNQVNLVPEGIAIDPLDGTIYISSIAQRKIIKILPDGVSEDFIKRGQDNFLEGLGMKVDSKTGVLWALSNFRKGKEFTSQIHAFDLKSGRTMHHFRTSDTIPTLFNDLLIEATGRLFITDTYYSRIYLYDPVSKKLQTLINDTSKLRWPNGLDFLDNNNLVVACYGNGLLRINIPSRSIGSFRGFKDQSIAYGLDGLVVHGEYLFGVYNAGKGGYPTNAVIKYKLDGKKESIVSEDIIDKANAYFADPTTAAKYRNKLYVIANSHLDQFNANKETVDGIENTLTPLKLAVYGL